MKKISFVAHSVGGLVARFAIGKLYRSSEGGSIEQVSTNECKEESKGLIADLEPVNFITVATPHLGSRGNKQVNFLFFASFILLSSLLICQMLVETLDDGYVKQMTKVILTCIFMEEFLGAD